MLRFGYRHGRPVTLGPLSRGRGSAFGGSIYAPLENAIYGLKFD